MSEHPGAGNLRTFTKGDPRARAAAQRSAEVRRAKREAGALAQRAEAATTAAQLARLVEAHNRDNLGPVAAAAAIDLIGRVSAGEVPVRHAGDAAELVRVLVDVARLEAGQATSQAVVAHLTAEATAQRFAELQQRARAVLVSPAVLAAGDTAGRSEAGAVEVVGSITPDAGAGA
jgi:hypothetical protein